MSDINVQKVPKPAERKLPVFEEMDRMMQRVRERAYAAFANRGFTEGDAIKDWLSAEKELCWPAAELVEHDKDYALSVAVAGFDPKDITVTATPRELIVSAKASASRGDKTESKKEQVCWSEFRSSDVYRRVELPTDIDVSKVSANYENGLLKIVAPKAETVLRTVPIAAAA
jgi:HSP20 family protein